MEVPEQARVFSQEIKHDVDPHVHSACQRRADEANGGLTLADGGCEGREYRNTLCGDRESLRLITRQFYRGKLRKHGKLLFGFTSTP